jgi:hypothetical protein
MSKNDQIVLEKTIEQLIKDEGFDGAESDYFELFCADQILKDYDLSIAEIESGIIGGGGDGGLDGFYLFVDQELAQDDFDVSTIKKGAQIELILIQAKLEKGFKESPIERFVTFSECVFNLEKEVSEFDAIFNDDIVNAILLFRRIYHASLTKKIKLDVTFCYCSKGIKVEQSVLGKKDLLLGAASKHFSDATFRVIFFGAQELLAEYRREPERTFSLKLAENPVSVADQSGCFVALVRLDDYFSFIANERGNLRRDIFEANVRDYQGRNEVNKQIKETLNDDHGEDFWWLNNGITIVASKASQSSKVLSIDDPQIVNGLQTSREIFEHFQSLTEEEKSAKTDKRSVLVRVIVPMDESSRDNIIRSTNSQTSIEVASLRSTDKIHRDIEDYFKHHGLFYDRRKNFHKNNGADKAKIVPVGMLAQAVTSILLQKPHVARARPSSLLKSDEQYTKVFGENKPVAMYYICAEVTIFVSAQMKRVSGLLSRIERNNLKFFVILDLMMRVSQTSQPGIKDICSIRPYSFNQRLFEESLASVRTAFVNVGQSDSKAKSDALTAEVIRLFEETLIVAL